MSKRRFIAIFLLGLFLSSSAWALTVPSYIQDPEDIKSNICLIINEKTATGGGFEDTALISAEKDNIIMKTISSLYAEAFTTLTGLSKNPSAVGDFVSSADPVSSTDKKEVLESEVQTKLNSIAKRLNSIVSLEAGMAELEGSMVLHTLQNVRCSSEALAEGE